MQGVTAGSAGQAIRNALIRSKLQFQQVGFTFFPGQRVVAVYTPGTHYLHGNGDPRFGNRLLLSKRLLEYLQDTSSVVAFLIVNGEIPLDVRVELTQTPVACPGMAFHPLGAGDP